MSFTPLLKSPAFNSSVKINNISCYSDDLFNSEELMFYGLFNIIPSRLKVRVSEQVLEYIKSNLLPNEFETIRETYENRYSTTKSEVLINSNRKELLFTSKSSDSPHEYIAKKKQKKDCLIILCYASDSISSRELVETLNKYIDDNKEDGSLSVHFLEKEFGELALTPHKLEHFPLDIESHYNDDFKEHHEKILEWATNFDDTNKKLSLFHGIPGAGKTNYIKYLMTQLPNVRKIYIPPFFVESIADPAFMNFIKDYDSSLLIAEDCEDILQKRENSGNANAASILLNLTDGILASVLNFKIICTFNSSENDIDPALLRKGRLFTKYKFDKLEKHKTEALYRKLYDKSPPEPEMDLAAIYNSDDNGIVRKEERRVGFGV